MVWIVVFFIAFCLALFFSVIFRLTVFHFMSVVYNGIVDFYYYLFKKGYNKLEMGFLICYVALFGKGKTLSVVHYVVGQYRRYNGKLVWSKEKKKYVTQVIEVLSNVELKTIPYTPFISLAQIIECADKNKQLDELNDTLTCTLVLGDEFSVMMNSRTFKTNISTPFLNTLLTCRHYHCSIVYNAQRFNQVDALLRQVTSFCISCNKIWRYQILEYFDAWEMENCSDPTVLVPKKRTGWFIKNKHFNEFDTLACVEQLSKSDFMTNEEILASQCATAANMDAIVKPSKKFIKSRKKMTK
ncbi:MAG TPA: hypothetical protein VJ845_00545 [Haploplasma sp.]|nr:hypothetical protein [Haploplasma sp.]